MKMLDSSRNQPMPRIYKFNLKILSESEYCRNLKTRTNNSLYVRYYYGKVVRISVDRYGEIYNAMQTDRLIVYVGEINLQKQL